MSRSARGVIFVVACVAVAMLRVDMATATTPVRALSDDLAFTDSSPEPRALAFATARRAGARVVRITLDWSRVAPDGSVKPPGFRAADPADPGYRWGYVEDAVRDAAARHLRVLLVIDRAPAWAGERKPDPGELGAFARAAARRFSGFYPDPKNSGNGLTSIWQVAPPGSLLAAVGSTEQRHDAAARRRRRGPLPQDARRGAARAPAHLKRKPTRDRRHHRRWGDRTARVLAQAAVPVSVSMSRQGSFRCCGRRPGPASPTDDAAGPPPAHGRKAPVDHTGRAGHAATEPQTA